MSGLLATVARQPRWLPGWLAPVGVGVVALGACAVLAIVDPNQPGRYPLCPFRAATGLDCPGCGTLRAIHALTGGDVARAADHNVLSVLLLPVLAVAWVRWLLSTLGRGTRWMPAPGAIYGLFGVVVAFWVARNLPVEALSWLGSAAG